MISKEEIQVVYKSLTFFDKLSRQEQAQIMENVRKVAYKKGENAHGGINTCHGIMIPKSGSLRVYILSENGKEVTLYRLEEGGVCVLSASCILNNITFDVHIDAEEDSEILLVDLGKMDTISRNMYVENFLLKETVGRFSDVMWAMEKILFLKLDERLAVFLLDEIARNKSNIISQTHEQIAKHLGSAREAVSRMLSNFAREGLVELSRGELTIKNKQALRELSAAQHTIRE